MTLQAAANVGVWRFIIAAALTTVASGVRVSHSITLYESGIYDDLRDFFIGPADDGRQRAAEALRPRAFAATRPLQASGNYSFATMAYGVQGEEYEAGNLWSALALARSVQRVSKYPLVLFTNITNFPDGTLVAEAFRELNALVKPLMPVPLPERLKNTFRWASWEAQWLKLQVFNLVEYEKVIWLDTDGILVRSVDALFERSCVWAQRNDWECDQFTGRYTSPLSGSWYPYSGFMLLQPSHMIYYGLMEQAEQEESLPYADQQLIEHYFGEVLLEPVQLLDEIQAAFGQCIGKIMLPENTTEEVVPIGLPAYVKRSGKRNECFNHHVQQQMAEVGGSLVNMCHLHPVGTQWRSLFCEATSLARTSTPAVADFCDDGTYYR